MIDTNPNEPKARPNLEVRLTVGKRDKRQARESNRDQQTKRNVGAPLGQVVWDHEEPEVPEHYI
jgi:hypothetical protein